MAGITTVYSDASWCPQTHVAGWGCWVKSDLGQLEYGRAFPFSVITSGEAETLAAVNALHIAASQGLIIPNGKIVLRLDCLDSIRALQGEKKKTTHKEREGRVLVQALALRWGVKLEIRHVKAHTEAHKHGTGAAWAWVQDRCDILARTHMRIKRKEIVQNATDEEEPDGQATGQPSVQAATG